MMMMMMPMAKMLLLLLLHAGHSHSKKCNYGFDVKMFIQACAFAHLVRFDPCRFPPKLLASHQKDSAPTSAATGKSATSDAKNRSGDPYLLLLLLMVMSVNLLLLLLMLVKMMLMLPGKVEKAKQILKMENFAVES